MGKFKQQVDQLLDKEIDRKQFLQYSGTIFLAAFGITGLINALLSSNKLLPDKKRKDQSSGYGSSSYGS